MNITNKLKETLISVLPIVFAVLILNFTIAPLGGALKPFLVGSVLLIVGLTIFLCGIDIGMVPVGEKLGSVIAHKQSLPLVLTIGFLIGLGVTLAEPDVNVLASQVHLLNPQISERTLVICIALGLGVFVDIGLYRVIKQIPIRWVLFVFYLLIFALVPFIGQQMGSISFDASGATTGPLAVPFILALGLGVSSAAKEGQDSSFGLTGIASIGPILAVILMSVFTRGGSTVAEITSSEPSALSFVAICGEMIKRTAIGFAPVAGLIIIFQFTLLHFPKLKFIKICQGIVYSFIGIVLFLAGVEYGFSNVGYALGSSISSNYPGYVSVIVAVIFGAIVVCAEPAVWVLTSQVEEVTSGRIKRKMVLVFLCMAVACAVGLAVVRIIYNISFLWFIYFGVGLSLLLTFFSPPLFTGIAFDSGGVASGPMSTTFLLSFTMGISGSAEMGFGLVGLIAISPLIAIQILGVLFSVKERKLQGGKTSC